MFKSMGLILCENLFVADAEYLLYEHYFVGVDVALPDFYLCYRATRDVATVYLKLGG